MLHAYDPSHSIALSGGLLEYAEALRTGHDLERAAQMRPRLLGRHSTLIEALEEVMPETHVARARRPPQRGERRKRSKRERRRERRLRDKQETQLQATAIRRVKPKGSEPTPTQLIELGRLAHKLGRPVPKVETRAAATAQIFQWQQVCKTLKRAA